MRRSTSCLQLSPTGRATVPPVRPGWSSWPVFVLTDATRPSIKLVRGLGTIGSVTRAPKGGCGVTERHDVVVLGTGAAGLTAAIAAHEGGADVVVFEKADKVGGTTAWSGGQVWIPNNRHMHEVGVTDSREQALTYIMSLSRDLL